MDRRNKIDLEPDQPPSTRPETYDADFRFFSGDSQIPERDPLDLEDFLNMDRVTHPVFFPRLIRPAEIPEKGPLGSEANFLDMNRRNEISETSSVPHQPSVPQAIKYSSSFWTWNESALLFLLGNGQSPNDGQLYWKKVASFFSPQPPSACQKHFKILKKKRLSFPQNAVAQKIATFSNKQQIAILNLLASRMSSEEFLMLKQAILEAPQLTNPSAEPPLPRSVIFSSGWKPVKINLLLLLGKLGLPPTDIAPFFPPHSPETCIAYFHEFNAHDLEFNLSAAAQHFDALPIVPKIKLFKYIKRKVFNCLDFTYQVRLLSILPKKQRNELINTSPPEAQEALWLEMEPFEEVEEPQEMESQGESSDESSDESDGYRQPKRPFKMQSIVPSSKANVRERPKRLLKMKPSIESFDEVVEFDLPKVQSKVPFRSEIELFGPPYE
jgi:hypothetical protein